MLHDLYYSQNSIKKNEKGGAYGTQEAKRKIHTGFWLENWKERCCVEDLRTEGMIMKWILKKKV
jgi:hypothetical protein